MSSDFIFSKRIKFIAFFIPILWVLFGFLFIQQRVSDLKEIQYKELSRDMEDELQTLITEKKETILIIAMAIASNTEIRQALLQQSTTMTLNAFSWRLKENTSLNNIWFQVIAANGKSAYRSWTTKSGDDLSKARLDVSRMIKNPKISSSISTGKFDLSFKSMVPIYNENIFIGFIEVLGKFNSIASKMQKKDYDIVILVDKKYKQQLTHAHTKKFVDDYYVANMNAKPTLLKLIKNETVEHYLSTSKHHTCQNTSILVTTYHLKDIHNEKMAYFLLFKDINHINVDKIIQTRDRLALFFFLVFIFLSAVLYYSYSKKYKKFIHKINLKLEEEVIKKTQELQKKTNQLEYLANHDPLTGLANRLLFLDRLGQSTKHAKRSKTTISVLFLDLDRFKEVNDTYGHEVGDKLLQAVAKKLQASVREEDSIARLGGDEFTIILQDIDDNDIITTANKITALMQEKITIDAKDIYTTFSIGISRFPEDGVTPEILLRNADTAMYKAKEMGKNQYQFYNQKMTELAVERSTIEHQLRLALENNELIAYYQPKIDANTKTVVGMEALVRWNHKEFGIIMPDKFISIAEDTGLIIPLDKWMMRETMRTMKVWHNQGLNTGKLSINLSIKQLEDLNCVADLKALLDEIDINPHYIELEVTESQIMKDPELSINILSQIRDLGISISIDDFGTGYSSLSYLKKLPIDKVKIDRSFIQDLPYDENDIAIVRAIIALASSLKLEIIAEGVETKEQLDFLVNEGCSTIQGYYYSKPIPKNEYEDFLVHYQ